LVKDPAIGLPLDEWSGVGKTRSYEVMKAVN
jgi:hypothetical protein